MLNQQQAQAVVDAYQGLSQLEQAHMLRRLMWCQYDEIADALPASGDILDIGCGYGHFGVYLTERSKGVRVFGCDPDERKIKVAQKAAPNHRRAFHQGDCRMAPGLPGQFDGVVLLDILYLMPKALQEQLLNWAAAKLKPGGSMAIKTIDPNRGLKSLLAVLQEWVMVRLMKKTLSSGAIAAGQDPEYYTGLLAAAGVQCRVAPLVGNKTPAVLILGRKH